MTTDLHGLISQMATELDRCQQLLLDDRRQRHPLADHARAALDRWGHQPAPPAEGEVGVLVKFLREQVHACLQVPWTPGVKHFGRAADLLEQRHPAPVPVLPDDALIIEPAEHTLLVPVAQPVPVSERLPEPGDCDAEGRCWLGGYQMGSGTPTWLLGYPAWAERFPNVHRFWLPAHALPTPETTDD